MKYIIRLNGTEKAILDNIYIDKICVEEIFYNLNSWATLVSEKIYDIYKKIEEKNKSENYVLFFGDIITKKSPYHITSVFFKEYPSGIGIINININTQILKITEKEAEKEIKRIIKNI